MQDLKAELRRHAKATRAEASSGTRETAGAALAASFFARDDAGESPADAVAPGVCVSGYDPIGTEIDPGPLMAALFERGVTVCLPVIDQAGGALSFRTWHPDMVLEPHGFGTSVPPADQSRSVVPALLLVPLLAFDRRGGRLGYGQGHYDRTLSGLRDGGPVLTVGLAFSAQEIERVPIEAHDIPLDWVVTEKALLRCRS